MYIINAVHFASFYWAEIELVMVFTNDVYILFRLQIFEILWDDPSTIFLSPSVAEEFSLAISVLVVNIRFIVI